MTLRLGAYILVAALSVATGWLVRGWQEDSTQLAVERAAKAIVDKATSNETGIAKRVEDRLAALKANERVIDRGVIREVQNPIYRNVCLPDSALRLLNDAARGRVHGQSAEPAEAVPGRTAGVP